MPCATPPACRPTALPLPQAPALRTPLPPCSPPLPLALGTVMLRRWWQLMAWKVSDPSTRAPRT
eukprot:1976117-Alexandrium_andersonii.AAC.1